MSRFRLLLAWLMLAALPLQGWAAASMLYCGPAQRAAVHAAASAQEAGHHDMHAAHHDVKAGHHAQQDHAGVGDTEAAQPAADASSHTCGVCAACCHGVALAQTQHWAAALPAPAADIADPLVALLVRPSTVPDKPPRA